MSASARHNAERRAHLGDWQKKSRGLRKTHELLTLLVDMTCNFAVQ
jgi:hypothetical protein